MRLKDADALVRIFKRWDEVTDYSRAERNIIFSAINEVEYAPTVDAEQVRRGRWIHHPTESLWDICSVCGTGCKRREKDNGVVAQYNYRYCPYCGAMMGGENDALPEH